MPPGAVTVMSTVPAVWAGLVAVIWVSDTTLKAVAATVPNTTAEAPLNAVPVMVTDVPPPVAPAVGDTPVTVGWAPTKVNLSAVEVALVPPGPITVMSKTPAE